MTKKNYFMIAALCCAFTLVSCEKTADPIMPDEENIVESQEFPTEDTDIATYTGKTLVIDAGQSQCSSTLAKRLTDTGHKLKDDLDLIILGEDFAYDDGGNTATYAKCIEMFDEGRTIALVRPTCKELETFRIALCNAYDMYVGIQAQLCGSEAVAPKSVKNVMASFSIPEDANESDVPYEIVALGNSGFFYQHSLGGASIDTEEELDITVSQYASGTAANNFVEWMGSRQTLAEETKAMGPVAVKSSCPAALRLSSQATTKSSGSADEIESIYDAFTSVYYLPGYVCKVPYAIYSHLLQKSGATDTYPKDDKYDEIPNMVKVTLRAWGCHSYSLNEDYYLVKQEITCYNGRLMPSPVKSGHDWTYYQQNQCYYTRYFDNLETSLSMEGWEYNSTGERNYKYAKIVNSLPEAENSSTEYSVSVAKTSGFSAGFSVGGNGGVSGGKGSGGLNLGFDFNWSNSTTITNSTSYTVKDIDIVKNSPDEYKTTWTYTGADGFAEEDKNGKLYHSEGSLQRSDCTLEQSVVFKITTKNPVCVLSDVKVYFATLIYPISGEQWKKTTGTEIKEHETKLWQPARNLRRWSMNVSSYGNFTTVEEKNAFIAYLSSNCSAFWHPYLEVGETDDEDAVMLGNWRRFKEYMDSQMEYFKAFGCSGHFEFVCQNLDEENTKWVYKMDL